MEEVDAPVRKLRRKRDPSVIDQLAPYNVAEDILNLPASATIGQMLQYPNQRRNLAKVLRRPFPLHSEIEHQETVPLRLAEAK